MACGLPFAPESALGRQPRQIVQRDRQHPGHIGGVGQERGLGAAVHPGRRGACLGGAQQPAPRNGRARGGSPDAECQGQALRRPAGGGQAGQGAIVVTFPIGVSEVVAISIPRRRIAMASDPGQRALAQAGAVPPVARAEPGGHVFRLPARPLQRGHGGQAPQLFQHTGRERRACGRLHAQAGLHPRDQGLGRAVAGCLRVGQHRHRDRLGQHAGSDGGLHSVSAGWWAVGQGRAMAAGRVARRQPAGWARTWCHGWQGVRAPRCALARYTVGLPHGPNR